MKWLIALFLCAVVAAATASVAVDFWDGRLGQPDPAMRAIHYDTKYNLSSQRRLPSESDRF